MRPVECADAEVDNPNGLPIAVITRALYPAGEVLQSIGAQSHSL